MSLTKEQVLALSTEQRNVMIAELCGIEPIRRWRFWYNLERDHGSVNMRSKEEAEECRTQGIAFWVSCGGESNTVSEVEQYDEWVDAPNYCGSLDAMASAEALLDENQREEYCAQLCHSNHVVFNSTRWSCASAKSEQRAVAFLMVMGKEIK